MTRFDAQSFRPSAPRLNPVSVDVPDIIRWIEDKRPRAIGDWNELGASEYARSFTAARTMGADVVTDLYEGLLATMRAGETESDFAARMLPVLRDKGWLPQLDDEALGGRLLLIYDTNLRTSQAVGKWRQFQRTKALVPYIRNSAVMDRKTRPSHAALHGVIAPVDHWIWRFIFAPHGFGCRCVCSGLTRSVAARYGGPTPEAEIQRRWALAQALKRGEGDLWERNMGVLADEAAVAQVQRVNDRRLPGSPPVSGTMAAGRNIWASLFADSIGALLERLLGEPS